MPSKEAIIDNVDQYTAAQLAKYIKDGVVSYEELCEEPEFSKSQRKEVKSLIEDSEEEAWQNALAIDSIEEYDLYLRTYSEGKHRSEAREAKKRIEEQNENQADKEEWLSLNKTDEVALRNFIKNNAESSYIQDARKALSNISRRRYKASAISRLKKEIQEEDDPNKIVDTIIQYLNEESISLEMFYKEIESDKNWLSSGVIDTLEEKGYINFQELEEYCGIDSKFFEYITAENKGNPDPNIVPREIESIGAHTTEIYFWGIPSSGKTCALGAIMSEAKYGGYVNFAEPQIHCQGYHYMTMLSQSFKRNKEVFRLPKGTETDHIFEMGYVLKRQGKDYPVTFIDLAGETIESMYKENTHTLKDEKGKKKKGLECACRILKGNSGINRKIHFFVLEYNGHTKTYKDLSQDSLLTGAMAYIKDTGIFKTETDAVYILVTKADLAGSDEDTRIQKISEYINTYYRQFHDGLKGLCVENEINGGEIDIIPFSLGTVCFQNLCLFDTETAATVVKIILDRATGFKTGKLSRLLNKFKK